MNTSVLAKPLAAIPVPTVGDALVVLLLAREYCLEASYHPAGGDSCHGYTPVTHTVYVVGNVQDIMQFKSQLEQK